MYTQHTQIKNIDDNNLQSDHWNFYWHLKMNSCYSHLQVKQNQENYSLVSDLQFLWDIPLDAVYLALQDMSPCNLQEAQDNF